MTLIDTHCHLNFDAFDDKRGRIIDEAAQAGVTRIINPGTDLDTSRSGVELARQYDGVYAAVGIHPNSSAKFKTRWLDELRALAAERKVIAIGEIGLDYYRDNSPKLTQWEAFEAQLALAADLALPVIIHNREASNDVLHILADWVPTLPESLKTRPGVLHSFSASPEAAEKAIGLGFFLGFTGPLTYKNADGLRSIATRIPADRLLIETDAPFLSPHPHRGKFPNQPAWVRLVAERLAALRRLPDDELAALTTANAERLFALPPESA